MCGSIPSSQEMKMHGMGSSYFVQVWIHPCSWEDCGTVAWLTIMKIGRQLTKIHFPKMATCKGQYDNAVTRTNLSRNDIPSAVRWYSHSLVKPIT